MQRDIADAVVDQLLELFDERFEAGPADYVLQRANVEVGDDGAAAVTVVWRPSLLGPLLGVRRRELGEGDAEALAWELYRLLEGGVSVPDEPPAADGIRWVEA